MVCVVDAMFRCSAAGYVFEERDRKAEDVEHVVAGFVVIEVFPCCVVWLLEVGVSHPHVHGAKLL